jgi:hypothetical protein
METKCINATCGKTFIPEHGNAHYCSSACKKSVKTQRQKYNNSKIKEFKKGFLGNYKLFTELLAQPGLEKMPLHSLLNRNFDQNAYYGTVRDKASNEWRRVSEFYFRVDKETNQPFLIVFKS